MLAAVFVLCSGSGWAAARPGREIVINLPAFRLFVYENQVPIREYPIGVGNVVTPSLLDSTVIVNKVAHPTYYPPQWWRTPGLEPIPPGPDNPVGTRWLGLAIPGYGIHGTNDPSSIGRAVSAGCIRMHNADVEELSDLVGVGTPVRFLYEPILVRRDPLLEHALLEIHPDLYRLGTNTVERALEKLAAWEVPLAGLSLPALEALLADPPRRPVPLPYTTGVIWDGHSVEWPGVRMGDLTLVPVAPLARALGEKPVWDAARRVARLSGTVVPEARVLADGVYAPPAVLARILGLGVTESETEIEFYPVRVWHGLQQLPVRAVVRDDVLLLPLEPLATLFGVAVEWDVPRRAPVIRGRHIFGGEMVGNRFYLPHDWLADLLGVAIEWQPGQRHASVWRPRVRVEGAWLAADGLLRDSEVFVPLRAVAAAAGYGVGWDPASHTALVGRRARLQGVVQADRLYVRLGDLAEALSDHHVEWRSADRVIEVTRRALAAR